MGDNCDGDFRSPGGTAPTSARKRVDCRRSCWVSSRGETWMLSWEAVRESCYWVVSSPGSGPLCLPRVRRDPFSARSEVLGLHLKRRRVKRMIRSLEHNALILYPSDSVLSLAPLDRQSVSEPQYELQSFKSHTAYQRSARENHALPQSER